MRIAVPAATTNKCNLTNFPTSCFAVCLIGSWSCRFWVDVVFSSNVVPLVDIGYVDNVVDAEVAAGLKEGVVISVVVFDGFRDTIVVSVVVGGLEENVVVSVHDDAVSVIVVGSNGDTVISLVVCCMDDNIVSGMVL